jgi:transcriptional regulator with XRE-family HTH domain
MIKSDLSLLGNKIARLRISKNLKQSELAYEAGVSERTLQRIEAGDTVKSDGLFKVIRQLGRLDAVLAAINTADFSPYKLSEKKPGSEQKVRVRRSQYDNSLNTAGTTTGKILWPEDQK